MDMKRLLLILAVLLLSLGLVRATLAAADSARQFDLPVKAKTIADQGQAAEGIAADSGEAAEAIQPLTFDPAVSQRAATVDRPFPADENDGRPDEPRSPREPADWDSRYDSSSREPPDRWLGFLDPEVSNSSAPDVNPTKYLPAGPDAPSGLTAFDTEGVFSPAVISDTGAYKMWYSGADRAGSNRIGMATSSEGITWTKTSVPVFEGMDPFVLKDASEYRGWFTKLDGYIYGVTSTNGTTWSDPNRVLSPTGQTGDFDKDWVSDPSVIKDGNGVYWMFYEGDDSVTAQIGVVTSTDGLNWNRFRTTPVLTPGSTGDFDEEHVVDPMVILDTDSDTFQMWYGGYDADWIRSIGYASSSDGVNWTKEAGNPVFQADPNGWDKGSVGHPAVVKGSYKMWYFSRGNIGYVTSTDGLDWTRVLSEPVLVPTEALFTQVDTYWDTVRADGPANSDITITLAISGGGEYSMTGQTDEGGVFRSWQEDWYWTPDNPDIEPGDAVTVTMDGFIAAVNPVGEIVVEEVDFDADTVSGTLNAPGFSSLTVACVVLVDYEPPVIVWVDGVAANDGGFTCDFSNAGWDLLPGHEVDVFYREPDFDEVWSAYHADWMRVHYYEWEGKDWVGGDYDPGHTFWITVTNGQEYSAQVTSELWWGWNWHGFQTDWWDDWDPAEPDIQVGNQVDIASDDGFTSTIQVGEVSLDGFDVDADTLSGSIHAPWFTDPSTLTVQCEILEWDDTYYRMEGVAPVVVTGVEADGGAFTCDFSIIDWDLIPGDLVGVFYYQPGDYAAVINRFVIPYMRVDYGQDWVGGDYPAGHTMFITVTDSGGAFKARAEIPSEFNWGWDGDGFETWNYDWYPLQPDIQAYDLITITSDDGYFNLIQVGDISGTVDLDNDTISGPIDADWLNDPNPVQVRVRCVPRSAPPDTLRLRDRISPDGVEAYVCDWSGEWDIQQGYHILVQYNEPDNDLVMNHFIDPAPQVQVDKWVEGGGEAMPGGPLVYSIRLGNYGDLAASSIRITDTLPAGTAYLTDSSGLAASLGSGEVAWVLDSLDPSAELQFYLALTNTADISDWLENYIEVIAPHDYTPWGKESGAAIHITDGEPDVWVDKHPEPGDPAAGETFMYALNYGNNNSAASGLVRLTDTLPLSTTVVSWHSENGYNLWREATNDGEKLALEAPTIPGWFNDRLMLRLLVDSGVSVDTQLTNSVRITTALDTNPDNNQHENTDAWVRDPRWDVGVYKNFNGMLVPGGELRYNLHTRNYGNQAVQVALTDTLPVGFSAEDVRAMSWMQGNYRPFPPDVADGRTLVWDLGVMEPGESVNIDLEMPIDDSLTAGTVISNCAEIGIDALDDNPTNDMSCVVEPLNDYGPNLRVEKEVRWQNGYNQLYYEIDVKNLGTTLLEDISITDTLPISTEFNGNWWTDFWRWIDDPSADNGKLVWQVEEVEPGWEFRIYLVVDLEAGIRGQGGLYFTNTVSAPVAGDVVPEDNEDLAVAYSGPEIYIDKWLSGGDTKPGELVTYTIQFGNQNVQPWNGDNSTITDTLPAEMTFITATAPWDESESWEPDIRPGNVLVWDWGTVWAESWWEFDLVARISETIAAGEVLTNRIIIYGDDPDEVEVDYSNNVAEEALIVIDVPIAGLAADNDSPTELNDTTTLSATITAGTNVSYEWDFGDGESGSGKVTTHDYGARGVYTAVVTATNSVGDATATTVVSITDEPIAGLSAYNDSPKEIDATTTLSATITEGTNVTYEWDFGDGETGIGVVDTHVYTAVGSYTAVVTATNTANLLTATTSVQIDDVPITGLTAYNDSPTELNHSTTLSATISAGTGVSYAWDFGDGETGSGSVETHEYDAVGVYTAVVTATNSIGSVPATTIVTIIDETIAGLAADNDSPTEVNETTTLSATITAGTNVAYAWDFGDGDTGSGKADTHQYTAVGVYTAVVTATNSSSGPFTATTTVSITEISIDGLAADNDSPTALGSSTWLSATITKGTSVGYEWDFGDGDAGNGKVISHTYAGAGVYSAVVTATNSANQVTATTTVTVYESAMIYSGSAANLVFPVDGYTVTIQIPANSVTDTVELRFVPLEAAAHADPADYQFAGLAFNLEIYDGGVYQPGYVFKQVVTIKIEYTDEAVEGFVEDALILYTWTGSAWEDAACGAYDYHPADNWFSLPVCHLSHFSLFGQTGVKVYLPLTFKP